MTLARPLTLALADAATPLAPAMAQDAGGAITEGALELLTPEISVLILIDHQPQMAFGVQSIQHQERLNNVVGLTKAAKAFDIPTVFTTITPETFSGPFLDEITGAARDRG